MAKITSLPKVSTSTKGDLITIVQGGQVKNIAKKDLLGYLESAINNQSKEIKSLKKKLSRNTIDKSNPTFTTPVKGSSPTANSHLTTKQYVDKSLHNVLRDDGSKPIQNPLSYAASIPSLKDKDLVHKKYADDLLLNVLKNITKYSVNSVPIAKAGECFIMTKAFDVFAGDGPEIQKGDILICLDNSVGGTYSSVGHQFAIINSNVVSASEDNKGIVHIATGDDMETYESDAKAITPLKYKQSLDSSSMYNRTLIDRAAYIVVEEDKGILAVDNRRSACTITLPSVTSLKNPNMFKITIKDEFGQADLKNITIKASGATIDSKTQTILSNKYQAVTIYNDGKNYYVENNTHAPDEISEKVIQAGLVYPASTGAAETMYQADIDLSQFDIGQGFVVEVSGFFAANSETKTVIIDIDGNTTVTNATTTAPNSDQFTARVTVIKEARYAIAYGYMLLEGIAADTYGTNSLNIDWNSVITAKVTANAATTNTDIHIYSMILEPLK
jgi:hypothetical protein